MTKEELKAILKKFEYETSWKRMKIVQFHNTYVVCKYEEIVYTRNPWDPADIDEDVNVFKERVNLIDIAKYIEESLGRYSGYWHTIVEDIKRWCFVIESKIDLRKKIIDTKNYRKELIDSNQATGWMLHHIDRMLDIYDYELTEVFNK